MQHHPETAMSGIRILIVDDHILFRECLSRLLQNSEFQIVGECGSIADALNILANTRVDLVLLDHDLGAEQGVTLLPALKRYQENIKALVVTAGMSEADMLLAMDSGASGIFHKHKGLDQLSSAIHRVAAGGMWLEADVFRSLIAAKNRRPAEAKGIHPLTPRQRDVISGILDGYTNKQIALALNISETTVKSTIQTLLREVGVRTRSQLARIAIEKHAHDWLKPE
jgi:two-component system, NarL family, nitrate/nitrite response regulator NarL